MYQFSDQFTKATSRFADAAAPRSTASPSRTPKAFGLQLAALEESTTATFAPSGASWPTCATSTA